MKKSRSSISRGRSYAEIGEFWDEHDLSDFWKKTDLSEKIQLVARKQGVSSDTLVNLWLEQKIKEQRTVRPGRKLSGKIA
jgi:hypothetical protein